MLGWSKRGRICCSRINSRRLPSSILRPQMVLTHIFFLFVSGPCSRHHVRVVKWFLPKMLSALLEEVASASLRRRRRNLVRPTTFFCWLHEFRWSVSLWAFILIPLCSGMWSISAVPLELSVLLPFSILAIDDFLVQSDSTRNVKHDYGWTLSEREKMALDKRPPKGALAYAFTLK